MRIWRKFKVLLATNSPSLLVVGRLAATASALISAPIVARAIGPEGRGETAAAIALFNITPIVLALGIPLEIRRLSATSDGKAPLRTARLFCMAATLLSTALGILFSVTIFHPFESATNVAATLGVALSPLIMSWTCDLSVLIAHRRYRGVLLIQLVQPFGYLSLTLILWGIGLATPATVLMAYVLGTLGAFITGLSLTRTSIRGEYHSPRALTKGSIKFAGSAVAEAATSRLDQVLVLPLMGAFQAGLYSAAVTVASVPLALGQALGATYFTPIARANSEERELLKAEAVRSGIAMGVMSLPLIFVGAWIGIPLLFGHEFEGAVSVAWVRGIASCAMLAAFVCSMALAAQGKGIRMTLAQFSSLGVSIVLLNLIAPTWGAIGAAAVSVVSYLLLLVILIRSLSLSPREILPRPRDFRTAIRRILRDH